MRTLGLTVTCIYRYPPTYTHMHSHTCEHEYPHIGTPCRHMNREELLVGWNILQSERDCYSNLKCFPLAHPLSTCLPAGAMFGGCWTFRRWSLAQSTLSWGVCEGCSSGPGSCWFPWLLVHQGANSLCNMLLVVQVIFSTVMDQDPMKPWIKPNLSSVISIRDCNHGSVQVTKTDVSPWLKPFRGHLSPC